jgi:D-alanine-D-alanine ligase
MTEHMPLTIDVIMGGPGREAEVSRRSGAAIARGLRTMGHDVAEVDLSGELDPSRLRPGAVAFNIVHGTYGEDGRLQAVLEGLGVAYVGTDSAGSRLCMDKTATKRRLQEAGVRVPWGVEVDLGTPFRPSDLKLPHHGGLVLKPADDGSSVGLKMVPNPGWILPAIEDLLRDVGPRRYLIEERLPGPEYTVAVIDEDAGPRALPPLTISTTTGIFDYEAKYNRSDTVEVPVADAALAARLAAVGVAAHRACACRDLSRIDVMRTADDDLAVLEINTLPGFTDASLTPKAAAAAGISFAELVHRLACRASRRANQIAQKCHE